MLLRYAPLALLLAAPLALAQNLKVPENPEVPNTFNQPAFTVNSPDTLQRFFHNGALALGSPGLEEMFRPPYFTPTLDVGTGFLVGATVFSEHVLDVGDCDQDGMTTDTLHQVDLAPPLFEGGPWTDPVTGLTYEGTVTGDLVLVDGAPAGFDAALGCDPADDTPVEYANAADVAGNVAFIQRGECRFSVKAVAAQRAGARAAVIFIPNNAQYSDNRTATNMAVGLVGDGSETDFYSATDSLGLSIPVLLIPNGIGQPILDALETGAGVNVTLGVGPVIFYEDADADGEADPETPGLTDFDPPRGRPYAQGMICTSAAEAPPSPRARLEVVPNPASGLARVAIRIAHSERIRVAVYDVLGRQVALLHDGPVAGEAAFDLDVSALPPGLYVVHAAGAAFSQTTRLTVAR